MTVHPRLVVAVVVSTFLARGPRNSQAPPSPAAARGPIIDMHMHARPGPILVDGKAMGNRARLNRASSRLAGMGEIAAQYGGIAPSDERLVPFYALAERFDGRSSYHLDQALVAAGRPASAARI